MNDRSFSQMRPVNKFPCLFLPLITLGIPERGGKKGCPSSPITYIPREDGRETCASCPNLWPSFKQCYTTPCQAVCVCIYICQFSASLMCHAAAVCVVPALCVQMCAGLHVRIAVCIYVTLRLRSLPMDGDRVTA